MGLVTLEDCQNTAEQLATVAADLTDEVERLRTTEAPNPEALRRALDSLGLAHSALLAVVRELKRAEIGVPPMGRPIETPVRWDLVGLHRRGERNRD